ncbi:MAG: translocation protein TolB [Chlamydiota bacterium]
MIRVFLFLLPLLLFGQEIEVRLPTKLKSKAVYLSQLHTHRQEHDWRYFEEVQTILEFDLKASGFCHLLPTREDLETTFHFPDVRTDFNMAPWKKEKIPFVIALQVFQNCLQLTAFNIEKGTSKKYSDIPLTGSIEKDRIPLHRLTDTLQKDLFGKEGIASLRILYAKRLKNEEKGLEWLSEIWICDADGGRARQLTQDKSYCLSPSFLPKTSNGDLEFFYVSDKIGQSKIYRASLANPKGVPMVELRGNQALASLSRQGNQMAFITDVAGRPDLFIQNLDPKGRMLGKARQLYSSPRATQASPTFSPDGKRVAFVSDKDGPPRIYLLDVIGAKETKRAAPKLLTRKNRENTSPSWSPDGTKLAYSAKTEGVRQIWIYDFESEEEMQLTNSPENKENPSWAPDNFHLVYNTEFEDTSEIYLIDLNQSDPIQITKGAGQKRFASWEPR